MTKRNSAEESAGTVRRKRLAFGVPKHAATKAIIQRNSTESPLLRLPLECREQIWIVILGGGILHLKLEPSTLYDSDTGEELPPRKGESLWSAEYCALEPSEPRLEALIPDNAVDIDQDLTDIVDVHPHDSCFAERNLVGFFRVWEDPDNTLAFSNTVTKPYLQLLRTCRQVCLEASRVLWTTNTFSFNNPKTLKMFMNDRKSAQKRLLKKLHLDMTWYFMQQKRAWEKALTLTLVRSLKGLKTLHLDISQLLLNRSSGSDGKADWETDLLSDSYFEEIMKLKMLPLETVTVTITNGPAHRYDVDIDMEWPLVGRIDWAEKIRSQLLDPEGAARWREQHENHKELVRQVKEEPAQAHAQSVCFEYPTEAASSEASG